MHNARRHGTEAATIFHRACAVLCVLLLLFSLGHAAVGHAEAFGAPSLHSMTPVLTHGSTASSADSADACALCVALSTAVVLAIFAFCLPSAARPRASITAPVAAPLTGWHASLSCRPPPAV